MGITGLLPYVESACQPASLDRFYGKKVAVDVSSLIYKGLYHKDYLGYVIKYVDLFACNKIKAYFVFDGTPPDEKSACLAKREQYRTNFENKHENEVALRITPEILANIKQGIAQYPHVSVIQAPGEADPQLAYMESENMVDAIVTEDSDLIVYGCRRIVFKLRPFGQFVYYDREKLRLRVDFTVFRWICIMAGCDYLMGGLPGYGLTKAYDLVRRELRPVAPYDDFELRRILRKAGADPPFIEAFVRADHLFRHANVVNPRTDEILPLTPPDIPLPMEQEDVDATFDHDEYKKNRLMQPD